MDWQATEFNTAWRHAFMGLVRKDPRFQDPAAIKESIAAWTAACALSSAAAAYRGMDRRRAFTLADIVLGLSVHRWKMTPFAHPEMPGGALVYGAQSAPGVYAPRE
jgi:glutathione S-transferase